MSKCYQQHMIDGDTYARAPGIAPIQFVTKIEEGANVSFSRKVEMRNVAFRLCQPPCGRQLIARHAPPVRHCLARGRYLGDVSRLDAATRAAPFDVPEVYTPLTGEAACEGRCDEPRRHGGRLLRMGLPACGNRIRCNE